MNGTIRVLIVDDEALSRERLRSLLSQVDGIRVMGECCNGMQAIEAIETNAPDLVFLDVEMPELSGLDVVEAIEPERCPQVVFVTAHDKYLQRAFEVHALDYLRKPFTDRRFYDALRHARRRIEERRGYEEVHHGVRSVLAELRQRTRPGRDRLIIREKEGGAYQVVRTDQIDWIEAKSGVVLVHTGKESHTIRQTLAEIEQRLNSDVFLRIHRSYIVNRTRIRSVEPLWKGEYLVKLASGKTLGTGRTYRAAVEEFLSCA